MTMDSGPVARGAKKRTVFGEPLWLDALKTLVVVLGRAILTTGRLARHAQRDYSKGPL